MINPVEYTTEQIVYGSILLMLILMVLISPLFYILGSIFEDYRIFIGKVYALYKITGIIILIGLFLWIINQ